MKITKLGHCSMLVEVDNLRILTDPGNWSNLTEEDLMQIDVLLITHEHADHMHIESVQKIKELNPTVTVVTNSSVGKFLTDAGINFEKLEDQESTTFNGVAIEGFGTTHKEVYEEIGKVHNTGYFIDNKIFYPGDALTNPGKPVEVLALPVVGPWLNIKDAINYAKEIKPRITFPVHDGMLLHTGPFHKLPELVLSKEGIKVELPIEGERKIIVEI